MNIEKKFFTFYKKNKLKFWSILILGIPSFLFIGSLILPDIFWERFLWRYFWGPVVADAEGETMNGIAAGYNPVNTIVYAAILVLVFFGIYEIVNHFDIEIRRKLIYSLLPWIILGGSLRSLEDKGLFREPLDMLMISPVIYFVLGLIIIFLLLLYLLTEKEKSSRNSLKKKLLQFLVILPSPLIFLLSIPLLDFYSPSIFILMITAVIGMFLFGTRFMKYDENYLLLSNGMILLLLSLSYNFTYIIGANPLEIAIIIGLAAAITFLIILGLWLAGKSSHSLGSKGLDIFTHPLNLLICFSHLFDASSTYRGITAEDYTEKHVLPEILIDITGPWVMIPLNLFLVALVIYVLDILLKEELKTRENMVTLIKFVIIILGAAPAVRNTLRIAMGV